MKLNNSKEIQFQFYRSKVPPCFFQRINLWNIKNLYKLKTVSLKHKFIITFTGFFSFLFPVNDIEF